MYEIPGRLIFVEQSVHQNDVLLLLYPLQHSLQPNTGTTKTMAMR
jgi:hypothetical protein